jgi:hypothetical protein
MVQIPNSKSAIKDFHTNKNASLFNIKGGPLPPCQKIIIQLQIPTSSSTHHQALTFTTTQTHPSNNKKKVKEVKNLHLLSR